MSQRKISFAIGEYYHLFNRGVDKRPIFNTQEDKDRFIKLLYLCNGSEPIVFREISKLPLLKVERGELQVAIGAYCLMPNHFHLLVKETKEGGITKFMSKLLTAYSSFFNKKYERTGALFGSEFKSVHIDNDEYLKYIYSYIHLNPIRKLNMEKSEAESFLNNFSESSYLDYVGLEREVSILLSKLSFPEYFFDTNEFKNELFSWFDEEKRDLKSYPHLPKAMPWEGGDNSEGDR